MASKTTTPWLKEALLLLTRIPNLLAPYLLFPVIILIPVVPLVYVSPLTRELSRHLGDMEEHTDHSSAEYARLLEETRHDATRLLVISIAVALVMLALAFARQIITRFTASSASSSSGDRYYSLAELFREVAMWRNLKIPLVATAALVVVVPVASMALLGVNFATVMCDSLLLSVRGSVLLVAFLAFLYMGALAMMGVARKRKQLAPLVLATLLLQALLIPVCEVAVLYLYTEQVMGLGLALWSVYDFLQAVQQLLYLLAANVYHSYYSKARAMEENKETTVVACDEGKEDEQLNYSNRNVIKIVPPTLA